MNWPRDIEQTRSLPSAFVVQAPRQLVLRPDYFQGEALPSHVDRFAHLHHTTLRSMLIRLGVTEEGRWKEFSGYGVTLAEDARRRYSIAAGLSEEQVGDMLMTRYSGNVITFREMGGPVGWSVTKTAICEWVYFKGSHFCAECLRESGGVWLSDWKLPWSFACAKHGLLLHHICPDCGRRPRAGRTSGLYPAFYEQVPNPFCCNNSRSEDGKRRSGNSNSHPCGCSFVELQGVVAAGSTLEAQARIDIMLSKVGRESDPAKANLFFGEMRSVCALILHASEIEDFELANGEERRALNEYIHYRAEALRDGKTRLASIGTPTNSALMAAVAQKALAIVAPLNAEELRCDLRVLADRISLHPGSGSHRWATPQLLRLPQRIRSHLERFMATRRGRFDRRVGVRSPDVKVDAALSYQACNVPQLTSSVAYNTRFRRFFSGQRDEIGRRSCAVLAVKLLGFNWAEAASSLELPRAAAWAAQSTISELNGNGTFDAFADELRAWAAELGQASVQVDYQMRRAALRSLKDFEFSEWVALCNEVGFSPGRPGGRSRFAAAWMWAHATSGDWHLSPAIQSRSLTNIASQYRVMMRVIHPAMTQVLQAEAARRIQSYQSRPSRKGGHTPSS